MYEPRGTVNLSSGACAEVGIVCGPHQGDPYRIGELLQHKQHPWHQHIVEALEQPLGDLETRFHIVVAEGLAVANVMTVESGGVGILGHVFTRPEHRRQGLCQALFEVLLPDFRARGGRQLTLGTGYDSPAYWIYHRNGFRPLLPESGFMRLRVDPDFAATWFAPGPTRVVPLQWRHWATVAQLLAEPLGDGMACWQLRCFGPKNFEGSFLHLFIPTDSWQGATVRVLETAAGAAVGFALLHRDRRWPADVKLLDVVSHPNFEADLPALLAGLPLDGRVQCYLPAAAEARRAAVEAAGFGLEGTFAGQLGDGGDVVVYGKS